MSQSAVLSRSGLSSTASTLCKVGELSRSWDAKPVGLGRFSNRAAQSSQDRGGNSLRKATSLRPYLQGLMVPGSARTLRDRTSRTDPDFYRLFDSQSPNTFQADGLLISYELRNLSSAAISITLLNRQGRQIPGGRTTVAAGTSFVSDFSLSRSTYYIKVTTGDSGQNRYVLNLPIINS